MRFSELDGLRIGVWGAGREIRSLAAQVARRLPRARIEVIALDLAPVEDPRLALGLPGAQLALGSAISDVLSECDVVVRSPGVSLRRQELARLAERGIPVATATGLWLAEREGRGVVGVTGTKGKSTTASLVHHLLLGAGKPARLAGNIGRPALDLLDAPGDEVAVVELSSYQIADLPVAPEVAVVTNLYREHLDWHGSEEAYRDEKLRLLRLPGLRAAAVTARDEAVVAAAAGGTAQRLVLFGEPGGWDATAAGDLTRAGAVVAPARQLPLRGAHNALNLCAALAALEALGVEPPPVPAALAGFRALPHRLETVAERDGVTWVDDSISTTPESALAALAAFPGRQVVLVGGGMDRGQDYAALGAELARREATVVGVPTTGERLLAAARAAGLAAARARHVPGMEAAVAEAARAARPGAVVLLSPAAPSYDRYRSFEERGDHFRALVEALGE